MQEIKLDLKDRKILYELDFSARQSNAQMGKKVGLHKDVVNYRIKRMEKAGLIKGYYTVIDASKLGYIGYRLYFKFQNLSPEKQKELVSFLVNHKKGWWMATLQGCWDYGFLFWVKDVNEYFEVWNDIMDKYMQYIKQSLTCVYSTQIFRRGYLIGKEKTTEAREVIISRAKPVQVNKLELQILKQLAPNAKISIIELVKKIGSTPRIVSYHIKQLEKEKIILAYRAMIDTNMLGNRLYHIFINLKSLDRLKELRTWAKLNQYVIYANEVVGGAAFEIEPELKNEEELYKFMENLRSQFKDVIDSYTYFRAVREDKILFLPLE